MSRTAIVIAAGGRGSRMSAGISPRVNVKQLLPLSGRPVLWHCLSTLVQVEEIQEFVVVTPAGDPELRAAIEDVCRTVVVPGLRIVPGGDERQQSVYEGLAALSESVDVVAIHDAARPLVGADDVRAVLQAARRHGAATLAVPVKETLAEVDGDGWVRQVPPRDGWYGLQTPQAFDRTLIVEAHERALNERWKATDDVGLVMRLGRPVRVVHGSPENIKLTTPVDFGAAEAIVGHRVTDAARPPAVRVGIGYDIHRFEPGRRLVLGGVHIPSDIGLEGHSDADVVLHAVMDALLGAVGEGDIGAHFPNTDAALKGVSSVVLLARVKQMLDKMGARPGNVDVAVVAEAPKLAPYVVEMAANIADALGLSRGAVAVKATTNERIGALGRGEGIAAWATATVLERGDVVA